MDIIQLLQDYGFYFASGLLIVMIIKTPILAKYYKLEYITADKAYEMYKNKTKKTIFLDIRTEFETARGPNIKKSKLIPLSRLSKKMNDIKKWGLDNTIILVCHSGRRTPAAGVKLKKAGFNDVFLMSGGIASWEKAGYLSTKRKK